MPHLSDEQIGAYARRTLGPADLLAADDHLAACEPCQRRASSVAGITSDSIADMRDALLAADAHLTEAQIATYVNGALARTERDRIDGHLSECSLCAREVRTLRAWTSRPFRRLSPWAMAAAAVLMIGAGAATVLWRTGAVAGRQPDAAILAFDSLTEAEREQVRRALAAGIAELPADLVQAGRSTEALMGTSAKAPFRVIAPMATAVMTDRPTFTWEPLADATQYTVSVFDETFNLVAQSSPLQETHWAPVQPLARGRAYLWQVSAGRHGPSIVAPAPPLPSAKVLIVDEAIARRLAEISAAYPDAQTVLGILYAQAGLRSEAEKFFARVPPAHPDFELARRTLERLARGQEVPPPSSRRN